MKTFEGKLVSKSIKVGIVAARFNDSSPPSSSAVRWTVCCATRFGRMTFMWRGFPEPLRSRWWRPRWQRAAGMTPSSASGAVIRGSTSHYDYVCSEVSKGIAAVSLESGVPVLFGVLTTENIEQAIERAGTKAGNKGYDCAVSAIEMVNLLHELDAE